MSIATVTSRGFLPGGGNVVLMGFGNGASPPPAVPSLHATIPTMGYGDLDGTIASVTLRNYGNTANAPITPPDVTPTTPPSRGGPPLWWWKWIKQYEDECPANAEDVLEDLTAKETAEADDALERAVYAVKTDQVKVFNEAQREYQRVFSEIDCLMKGEIRGLWASEVKMRLQEEEEAMELMHLANEFFTFFD